MGGIIWIDQCSFHFRNKKHHCPNCQAFMNRVDASRRVNTKSPEAQKPENAKWLSGAGFRPTGNVELVWTEFECPECGKHWTAEELREIEETARLASKVLRIIGELLYFALVFGLILFVTSRAD